MRRGGFCRVYVEHAWYSGPDAGVADVDGAPHYFRRAYDPAHPDDDRYLVWPVDAETLALEREWWRIYVSWHGEPHPATGKERYDELAVLLAPHHTPPVDAKILFAEVQLSEQELRYGPDGPDYLMKWRT